MPTKPTIASPVIATNTLYAAGARAGELTKIAHATPADGWTPGVTNVSEFKNYYVNEFGQWVTNWVALGTSSPDLDAHIVETDLNGSLAAGSTIFGGTALTGFACFVRSNASGDAMLVTDTIGANAIKASSTGASDATIEATNTGGGPAILGDGDTNGTGVRGVGGSASGFGVWGESSTALAAVFGETTSTSGTGVAGTTPAAATVSAFAVKATTGTGDATALKADSSAGDGYALLVQADTSSPVRAPIRMVAQDADPTTLANGDMWMLDEGTNERWLKFARGSIARFARDGRKPRFEDDLVHAGDGSTGGTATAAQSNGVTTRKGGDVIVTARCGISKTGATGTVTYDLESADDSGFTTAVTSHELSIVQVDTITNGATAQSTAIFVQVKLTPTGGDVQRFYRLKLTVGANTVFYWQPSIRIEGEFL